VIVVSRFDATDEGFQGRATAALDVLSQRRGFVRGRVGRAADDPGQWVLTTEWDSVGSYRRSLSSYEVKVVATTLMAEGRDEASAFEVVHAVDVPQPPAVPPSQRAQGCDALDREACCSRSRRPRPHCGHRLRRGRQGRRA
jgi:hypothetical protein